MIKDSGDFIRFFLDKNLCEKMKQRDIITVKSIEEKIT